VFDKLIFSLITFMHIADVITTPVRYSAIATDRLHTSTYWSSVVTVIIYCIVSEIERDSNRKIAIFFHTSHST